MKRWLFYTALAWHDIHRLWRATQYQVIIVAGICLPVLLLLGLKRGLVTELRRDLVTSPTGRQIICWSAQRGELFDVKTLASLKTRMPFIEVIVPEAQRLVRIETIEAQPATQGVGDSLSEQDGKGLITLYSTTSQDPILKQFHADVLTFGERAIVLTQTAANAIGVRRGSDVLLTVFRRRDGVDESHSLRFQVKAIIPSTGDATLSGYADIELLSQLEQYVRGHAVAELGLPAMPGLTPLDEYESYLIYCQKAPGSRLSDSDMTFLLERGMNCQAVEDADLKCLYGLINEERLRELDIYQVTQRGGQGESPVSLKTSPLFISENTQAIDDFVLRWNGPMTLSVGGHSVRLIGLSLPTTSQSGGWINDYFKTSCGFTFDSSVRDPFQLRYLTASGETPQIVTLALDSGEKIDFHVVADAEVQTVGVNVPNESARSSALTPDSSSQNAPHSKEPANTEEVSTAVIPANCLAWIRQTTLGKIVFDDESHKFASVQEPIVFDKARLYVQTIDDVPTVVSQLSERGFAVLSESNRIAEIQSQDRSLQILVLVVGVVVFVFGTVTVIGVLVDATERKRGTIGILRVMGMSRTGIFFMVVLRAVVVGLFAAGVSAGMGLALAGALSAGSNMRSIGPLGFATVKIVFSPNDYFAVVAGALTCSCCGALWPAWRASVVDPFDAIIEGKFH